ncbi:MAG: ParA family protein [Planctomycetes bacterium]|nr:ParA family protein [Planctomycetota bacterium]
MRKLLVASQKSGVGKTTTSINLAAATAMAGARVLLVEADPLSGISTALNLPQHPDRRQLRASGIDLPGVLCCGIVPGLDVFSPYEEGGCSDEDFDRILQLLGLDAFRESYDCLIVNAPPFLGARPTELLASCDEYVLVIQAESLAHRTMPAFLELVQRAGQGHRAATLRGFVLTLPESETPGGRWERELRGRFGKNVLSQVVPYDEEVGKASLFGHVVVHASPEAPASLAYQELAGELHLAKGAVAARRPADTLLSMAAAAVRANPLVARSTPRPVLVAGGRRSSARLRRVPASDAGLPPKDSPAAPAAAGPTQAPVPANPDRPTRGEAARRGAPLPSVQAPVATPTPAPARPNGPLPPLHSTQKPWLIWVGLAIAGGIGLRFVQLPDFVLPLMVGLAVTASVTLMLHLFLGQAEGEPAPQFAAPPATGATSGLDKNGSLSPRRK